MSIEYNAILIIAVNENDIDWDALQLTNEQQEELVEKWLIDSDSWYGGEHFFGEAFDSVVDAGQYLDITEIFDDKNYFKFKQKIIQTELAKCGLDVPLNKIKLYLICQVY